MANSAKLMERWAKVHISFGYVIALWHGTRGERKGWNNIRNYWLWQIVEQWLWAVKLGRSFVDVICLRPDWTCLLSFCDDLSFRFGSQKCGDKNRFPENQGCLFSNSFNKGSKKLRTGKWNSSKAQPEREVRRGTDRNLEKYTQEYVRLLVQRCSNHLARSDGRSRLHYSRPNNQQTPQPVCLLTPLSTLRSVLNRKQKEWEIRSARQNSNHNTFTEYVGVELMRKSWRREKLIG